MNTLDLMLQKARAVMKNSYAPYSNFHVGVCIRTTNDQLFVGCNYENASYSLSNCAEANAIGAMISAGEKHIQEMVIIGGSETPCAPCGACRQTIREFAEPETIVHFFNKDSDKHITMKLEELLPNSFGPQFLLGRG
jgi:cytidine deaminase